MENSCTIGKCKESKITLIPLSLISSYSNVDFFPSCFFLDIDTFKQNRDHMEHTAL